LRQPLQDTPCQKPPKQYHSLPPLRLPLLAPLIGMQLAAAQFPQPRLRPLQLLQQPLLQVPGQRRCSQQGQ
jgi:hypothetical protein